MPVMTADAPVNGSPKFVPAAPHPVVLFDGQCNLCNGAVNFIIRHDSRDRFRFASLQSPVAAELLRQHGLADDLGTIVMIDGDHAFTRSTAVLRIAAELDSPWPLAALAALIPRHLRDDAYAFVAKHRLQWFGRKDACRVPTEKDRERFLG
jgi:predicted DCC family thiol-disulfide oxidoreductase YuxK